MIGVLMNKWLNNLGAKSNHLTLRKFQPILYYDQNPYCKKHYIYLYESIEFMYISL